MNSRNMQTVFLVGLLKRKERLRRALLSEKLWIALGEGKKSQTTYINIPSIFNTKLYTLIFFC